MHWNWRTSEELHGQRESCSEGDYGKGLRQLTVVVNPWNRWSSGLVPDEMGGWNQLKAVCPMLWWEGMVFVEVGGRAQPKHRPE